MRLSSVFQIYRITSPGPFVKWFMSATNDNLPTIQPPRTWFASSWKARLRKISANQTDGPSSAGTCYMMHAILVMIHVVLVILYIAHWEHRVTLLFTPMNNDFWPVVLSASLQAFYTIYTAVLLFLTQRLAVSRTLVRRQKLTAIHDVSGAWAGLGSALSSVWQQTDVSASWWMTSTVAAYLACISVLHVTSSTLLQIQTFSTSMTTSVPTTLAWLNDLSTITSPNYSAVYDVNWEPITAFLPVFNQLPGVVSAGLSNTTVYDTPQQTNAIVGNATVNATTITSYCGLLPNISSSVIYPPNTSFNPTPINPMILANTSFDNGALLFFGASIPWSDQIRVLSSGLIPPHGEAGVVFMVSTLLDIDPSVKDVFAAPIPWEMKNSSGVLELYFVQCSLSAVSAEAVIDIQTKILQNPVSASQSSRQWEINQWSSDTWQSVIGDALAKPVSSGYSFMNSAGPSIVDEYIMSLVGLNLTAEYDQSTMGGLPIPAVVLSPDKLEAAIARVAAQLIWIVGQVGLSNGGLQPGNGITDVVEETNALRLNFMMVYPQCQFIEDESLQLSFAISASVIMMALAIFMTRALNASSNSQAVIPNTGVLQLLWLGQHSASVNEVLEDVEHPTEASLRRAGMINVCFAKTISAEEKLESSFDSLSGQVDHGRDDEM
ncbi:hypothetical protein DEU56DRAFT_961190 [Suillus clintonianus]|uniref:uncharacterized protein n=1 Tax=Suillus clintonianus TaxID=1904413 RepID=UPI001B86189D|nr:uncharacterized protein DEU56DRAFT_961190 [Suillus clintonianus]KAG2125724.1 hypothetical protein DEU56DRAFT_961190 [Suillus clintonianus]